MTRFIHAGLFAGFRRIDVHVGEHTVEVECDAKWHC